jgi:hypothetical protein
MAVDIPAGVAGVSNQFPSDGYVRGPAHRAVTIIAVGNPALRVTGISKGWFGNWR